MSGLAWRRDPNSGWWAYGEAYGYQVARVADLVGIVLGCEPGGQGWILRVREVAETAGVRHTLGREPIHFWTRRFDTLRAAKRAVEIFDADLEKDMHSALMAAIYGL